MSYYTHHKQLGIHHQQIAHTLIGGSIEWMPYYIVHSHMDAHHYAGVSTSSQTNSTDRKPMALRECVHYAWEQGTSTLSVTSGVAMWILVVAQYECLSPRVPSQLRFQHGRETGAASQHQILRQTRQIWSGDFWNVTTCVWKWGHVSCDVFREARALQDRQNITWRREVRANFHKLNP
jgi:hypothetical protein